MGERGVAVVIEDDEDIRAAVAEIFRQSGFAVHAASSGSEGLERVKEHNPDIVTIDIGLPDFDGLEASRRIRTFSDAYVIIVSGRADEADALMGFEAGADDYITKPFRPRELRARIKAMLRRPRSTHQNDNNHPPPVPPKPTDAHAIPVVPADSSDFMHKGLTLDQGTRQAAIDGVPTALTRSQFDILLALLKNGRTVQTKADLVRWLRNEPYNNGSFVSAKEERAVEVHLSNLRKKLGENPKRPRWIETVHGFGYRLTL
ncbi:response regulator transcription factor [Paenarthrobacter aurescens]|uniref:Two-component system response regulator n=1 Tax=Paenarthrobacter aurescens (strain TC1) TaxID=290340 RepID=A1RDR2_PAEAT|nr:response regulator transcription factor [Paenarthrobacter aurescens]ABM10822.1 putative two-component system response regulator [Paenarthrobacter aurescens TC1]